MNRIKLTVVLTHPIQDYASWFRHIEAHAPDIDLNVVHATEPTPQQQGVGFDRAFTWDAPLTAGYRSHTVRPSHPGDRIDSSHFAGLDVPEIGRAVAETSPDVVLVAGWYSMTLVRAIFACRSRGIPLLYRGDSHLLSGPTGWMRGFWALKTSLLLRQFDGYLSPGVRVHAYLRRFSISSDRIFKVPHFVDNEFFARSAAVYRAPEARAAARERLGISRDAFVPLFVGKMVASKRPLNVVRAVKQMDGDVSLLMVGSGPLERAVRKEAADLGVDLKYVGFMNQSELGLAYGVADCLTLPSDFPETWGLVVNEALATGLPCVVSDAVGCGPDLVLPGETGYVHRLDDIGGQTDALLQVRARMAQGYEWAPRCREVAACHSLEAATAGLARACRSVLRRSVGPEPASDPAAPRVLACCGSMVIAAGLERMTFLALRALTAGGARVHCIVNDWESFRITPMAESIGATWSTAPYHLVLTRRALNPAKIGRMVWEMLRVSADLMAEARRIRPTHVFVPDYLTTLRNAPALMWLRARGVKVVARLGNAPERGTFYRLLWRHAVNPLVDLFVANSGFTCRELVAHGVSELKILTIQNTAAPRRESWEADGERIPGRVIFVGQIIPEKGLDLLLDAVAALRGKKLNVTLDVLGDMDGWESPSYAGYRAGLRARAAQADLAGAVEFLGWREDVPVLMARASVHCCPSRPEQREAFGNVVLEAKLAGVPSVVTPSGDLPDLVAHEQDGWVCAEPTAAALAEGIEFFITSPARLAAAGASARQSASRYSNERFTDAWSRVFA